MSVCVSVCVPLVDALQRDLVRDAVGLLQEQDDPGRPVRPLLRQVDPRRQPVPVKDDLIGSQQTTYQGQSRGLALVGTPKGQASRCSSTL